MTLRVRLTLAVVVAVAALINACGATDAPATADLETAASPEIDQVVGDYFAAFNDYDADALRPLITDGYVLYEGDYSDRSVSTRVCNPTGAETQLGYVAGYNKGREYQFERLGETIMSGSGPWLVAQVIRWTSKDYPHGVDGISTLTIVDEGGTLKVARDIYVAFERK